MSETGSRRPSWSAPGTTPGVVHTPLPLIPIVGLALVEPCSVPPPTKGQSPGKHLLLGLRGQQVDSLPDIFFSLPPLPSSLVKSWWCSEASASGIFQPSYSLGWVYLSWLPSPELSETDFLSLLSPSSWPPRHSTQSKPCFLRSHRTLLCKAAHPCLHPHRHFSLGPQSKPMSRGLGESGPGTREPGRGTDGLKLSGAGRERRVHITAGTRLPYTEMCWRKTGIEWRKSSPKTT